MSISGLINEIDRDLRAIVPRDERHDHSRLDRNQSGKAMENMQPMAVEIGFRRWAVLESALCVEFQPDPLGNAD